MGAVGRHAAAAGALLCLVSTAWGISLRADTNRDGVVDVKGRSDEAGKQQWTTARGALLLPNIGDKHRRCPRSTDKGVTDAQLEACHDAADNLARAPENFAPLRTLPVPQATSAHVGRVRATGPGADKVRVFIKRGSGWVYLDAGSALTLDELRRGAVLGADARDVARNLAVWDGRVTIEFTVSGPGGTQRDQVVMRVAPVLTYNHTQEAVHVFVPQSGKQKIHQQFVTDLSSTLLDAGFGEAPLRLNTTDTWAQDFVEFGYVSLPRPGGRSTVLQIAMRSPQPGRSGGRAVFDLRGPGVGAVQTGGENYHQVDSFGNLETIPPYRLNGQSYPAGRVIYGDAGDGMAPHPDMRAFFAAQELQSPLVLDTSWLAIGHVDEFLQFLPADNARGWVVAVADVQAGLAVLRDAQARGYGGSRAYSYTGRGVSRATVDELLADEGFAKANALASAKIAENVALLRRETGLQDAEIIGVPVLFEASAFTGSGANAGAGAGSGISGAGKLPAPPRERIVYGPGTLIAAYPGAVNGLLLDRHNYIAPRQWGPLVEGRDLLQDAVDAAYARLGITVRYVDDWRSHHVIGGEVHCGTNATRRLGRDWWR